MSKTQLEVITEYQNRKNNPEYKYIGVQENVGDYEQYENPTNIKTTQDVNGIWLEFDTYSTMYNASKHIKVHGHIVKFVSIITE